MFTGLVTGVGTVAAVDRTAAGARLTIESRIADELSHGASVAISGVCLTALESGAERFSADVMRETLRRSSLGGVHVGSKVNLELPLRADGRLDGHIVQGHVDGVGTVTESREEGFARVIAVAAERSLMRYFVEKGSIAIDGVSLTVARVHERTLEVSLIPETLRATTLGDLRVGTRVNLEADVTAKHVERFVRIAVPV